MVRGVIWGSSSLLMCTYGSSYLSLYRRPTIGVGVVASAASDMTSWHLAASNQYK